MRKPSTWDLDHKSDIELLHIVEHHLWRNHLRNERRYKLRSLFNRLPKWFKRKFYADWYAHEAVHIVIKRSSGK